MTSVSEFMNSPPTAGSRLESLCYALAITRGPAKFRVFLKLLLFLGAEDMLIMTNKTGKTNLVWGGTSNEIDNRSNVFNTATGKKKIAALLTGLEPQIKAMGA